MPSQQVLWMLSTKVVDSSLPLSQRDFPLFLRNLDRFFCRLQNDGRTFALQQEGLLKAFWILTWGLSAWSMFLDVNECEIVCPHLSPLPCMLACKDKLIFACLFFAKTNKHTPWMDALNLIISSPKYRLLWFSDPKVDTKLNSDF